LAVDPVGGALNYVIALLLPPTWAILCTLVVQKAKKPFKRAFWVRFELFQAVFKAIFRNFRDFFLILVDYFT
jgi:hypothetical protein